MIISSARWLNKLGVKCDILTLSLELESLRKEKEIRLLLPPKEIKYNFNLTIHGAAKRLFLELKELCSSLNAIKDDYDIFNPHNFPAYWVFGLVKTPNRAKVVWTCHNVFDVYGPMIAIFQKNGLPHKLFKILTTFDKRVITRKVNAIVTVSSLHAREITRSYGKQPYIITPGIDFECYAQGNGRVFREKYNVLDSFLAIHVGNLIPIKNQEISIRAIAILRNVIPNIRLAVIGGGPDLLKLKKLVVDLNLEKNVFFTGNMDEHELRNAYKAANVNLLPSALESFGLTPIEALASGTISIVSKEAGVAEFLEKYKAGYVLENRIPAELAKAILHVYENPEEAKIKVEKAQTILQEKFSWKSYAQRLLEVYKDVLREDTQRLA